MFKKESNKLKVVYFINYFGDALYSPFLALFLISLGVSDTEKGILLSLVPIGTIIGTLIFSRLSGGVRKNLILMRILSILSFGFLSLLSFVQTDIFWLLFILILLFATSFGPYFPLQDGTSMHFLNKDKVNFPSLRIFGTIGYLGGLVLNTIILDNVKNYNLIFMIASICFAITFVLLFFIGSHEEDKKDIENLAPNNKEKIEKSKEPIKKKNNKVVIAFIFYIVFYILIIGSNTIVSTYLPIYYKGMGLEDAQWSLFSAVRIVLEIISFIVADLLYRRFKNYKVIIGSGVILYVIYYILLITIKDLYPNVIITSIIGGYTGGCFWSSCVPFINDYLGKEKIANRLNLVYFFNNSFIALLDIASPHIYNAIGFTYYFLIFLGAILVGGVFFIFIRKQEDSTKEVSVN